MMFVVVVLGQTHVEKVATLGQSVILPCHIDSGAPSTVQVISNVVVSVVE